MAHTSPEPLQMSPVRRGTRRMWVVGGGAETGLGVNTLSQANTRITSCGDVSCYKMPIMSFDRLASPRLVRLHRVCPGGTHLKEARHLNRITFSQHSAGISKRHHRAQTPHRCAAQIKESTEFRKSHSGCNVQGEEEEAAEESVCQVENSELPLRL